MDVYQFNNTLNNNQKWPRFFVAISLSRAKEIAKEFENTMNDANGNIEWMRLSFDYEHVIIVDVGKNYEREGYIELNDREI